VYIKINKPDMEKSEWKVEFKNLRLTLYKAIIIELVLMYYFQKYWEGAASVLENILGITTGIVVIGEAIKLYESGRDRADTPE
jgi:hypothetical protein